MLNFERAGENSMSNQEHVQMFVYKLPKKNHYALVELAKKFTTLYTKYGTQSWEIYQLNSREAFEGSTSLANVVSAGKDEEVWVELDHYRDRDARDKAVGAIMQDPTAGDLFRELSVTTSQGFSLIMGEFSPIKV
jgi:uncharacterized protein YbaA (DUF1428 family)